MLHHSSLKNFFLDPNTQQTDHILTPKVFSIDYTESTLDVNAFQYLIRKDVFHQCGIHIKDNSHILSFSTITYGNEQCYLFVVDITRYDFGIENPNVYPVEKQQLLQFIDDIRALAIYARFSLHHGV